MAKHKVVTLDQFVDGEFPVYGLDLSGTIGEQRPLTTRTGLNVRTYDALTMRARGGSRSGLSRLIDERVSGENRIDHLNMIVDPTPFVTTGTAEEQEREDDATTGIEDPSTSNRRVRIAPRTRVRRGGSARVRKFNRTTGTLVRPPDIVSGIWLQDSLRVPPLGEISLIWTPGNLIESVGGGLVGQVPEPPIFDSMWKSVQVLTFGVVDGRIVSVGGGLGRTSTLSATFRSFSYGFFNVSFAPNGEESTSGDGREHGSPGNINGLSVNPPGYDGETFTVELSMSLTAHVTLGIFEWDYDCGTLSMEASWTFVAD